MELQYVEESQLRDTMIKLSAWARRAAPGSTSKRCQAPLRPRNWRIFKLDVLVEDYGAARDRADKLEAMRRWIMVPDGHVLDGQVFGREKAR